MMKKNAEEDRSSESTTQLLAKLKDLYPLILSVPAIFGGLQQITNLYSFGVEYIRFFSSTQLLSDGLIISIKLGFLILSTFYCTAVIDSIWGYKKNYRFMLAALGIFLSAIIVAFKLKLGWLLVPMNSVIFLGFYAFVLVTKKTLNKVLKKTLKIISALCLGILIVFIAIQFVSPLKNLIPRSLFIFPSKSFYLENEKNFLCQFYIDNPEAKNPKIEYFNDKYIFVTYLEDAKSKLRIYLFEEYFKNCKT